MSLKTQYLEKLQQEKTFVDIYTDLFDDSNWGYIVDFNDEFIVLEKFSEESFPDGIIVYCQEDITRIRWECNEITSAEKLIDQSARAAIPSIDISSIHSILKSVNAVFGHINVHVEQIDDEVCFIGQIKEMDEDTLVLHEYGTKKSLDRGFILLSIEDITRVDAGGIYERSLEKLFIK